MIVHRIFYGPCQVFLPLNFREFLHFIEVPVNVFSVRSISMVSGFTFFICGALYFDTIPSPFSSKTNVCFFHTQKSRYRAIKLDLYFDFLDILF